MAIQKNSAMFNKH